MASRTHDNHVCLLLLSEPHDLISRQTGHDPRFEFSPFLALFVAEFLQDLGVKLVGQFDRHIDGFH